MKHLIFIFYIVILFIACSGQQHAIVVPADLPEALERAMPGDTILIKDGIYADVELALSGRGTAGAPIVVLAENPGNVFIEGKSCLHLGGEYVEINGLLFRNGYSPAKAVIEYRNGKEVANHCRITNCAISYFNPSERSKGGNWVLLYGQNNRFDHNSLVGKLNMEVTLAVILDGEQNQQNAHRIDHNYFGLRPILGSNGGETIRVGTSQQEMASSNTCIEDNIFEHCNGEVEVVSIKSCDNIVRHNLFLECSGLLALRHGNRNLVEGNFFIGNGKDNTGGIRVVNEGHTIRGNLFYRLAGDRFFAALGIMNAVPNSLPNRYHPVKDVEISNNRFIDCDHILFCVGRNHERIQPPVDVKICNNDFYHSSRGEIYEIFDDISGFAFTANRVNYTGFTGKEGFSRSEEVNGGIDTLAFPKREECGAGWYKAPAVPAYCLSGKTVQVAAGQNTLSAAFKNAAEGDVLELTEAAVYWLDAPLKVDKFVRLQAAAGLTGRPVLRLNGNRRGALIEIANGGALEAEHIAFDGQPEPGKAMAVGGISTTDGMITPYVLDVRGCEFYNFNESGFAAIRGKKGTFAPRVKISGCFFHDMSGEAINFAGENDDKGIYSVERLDVSDCLFFRTLGAALNLYRGGNDESTTGPYLTVSHCTFEDVNNREQGSVLRLIGVQQADVRDCIFSDSGRGGASIRFDEMSWDKLVVTHMNLWNSGRIVSFWGKVLKQEPTRLQPTYVSPETFDFSLKAGTALKGAASDHQDMGIL